MKKDDRWVEALQMSYDYRDEKLVFSDGVKYTVRESLLLAKGKLKDDDLRAIHLIKKLFDGEIEDCFGRSRTTCLSGNDGKMPEQSPACPVQPVLQKYYGRRKERKIRYDGPDQGVLNL